MKSRFAQLLLRLLALMPLRFNHQVGSAIGRLSFLLCDQLRTVTRINIDLCYQNQDTAWRQQLMRASFREIGKAATELGPLWCWSQKRLESLIAEVQGEKVLTEAVDRGRGVLLVTPHFGAWELVNLYTCTRFPMTVLFRPPRVEALHPLVVRGRERFGARLVATDRQGVKALFKALAAGEVVGMLPDQEPRAGTGVFAPFFGIPAYTMILVTRLARKTQAPVVFTLVERLPAGKGYRLEYFPAPEGVYNPDPIIATSAINHAIEACIATNPAQYLWSYKRFRLHPNGGANPYRATKVGNENPGILGNLQR